MRRLTLRSWKTAAVLVVAAAAVAVLATGAFASSHAKVVKVAIMTDCKGAFAFGYDVDIGGAQTAFAQFAHGVTKSHAKPSAGMTGIHVGATPIKIVGYGCGNDTVPVAVTETKRLMEKLNADVMIGPLSGDEAVYIANYAKAHPTKTFIIGTAGSQDPTMQIAPKNMFRYHGDGAQWNAGIGEIAYKKLGWRKAAIMMDDYSFGWTSGAGMIADFCAVGGNITKRVFPPLNTTDYAPFVRQLPPPNQVDGYFWVVGGTGTGAALKAYEQAYGKLDPKKNIGNLFFGFLGADKVVAPKVVGAYVGGFGNMPGRPQREGRRVPRVREEDVPDRRTADDGFFYNYYMAAKALTIGLARSRRRRRGEAPGGAAAVDRRSVPDLQRRHGQARLPPPGDPGPVPAPARQERRRVGEPAGDRVRPERRSVVRRPLHAVEPAARAARSLPCKKLQDALAGQDPGRRERQGHDPDPQVGV